MRWQVGENILMFYQTVLLGGALWVITNAHFGVATNLYKRALWLVDHNNKKIMKYRNYLTKSVMSHKLWSLLFHKGNLDLN
jgi:hypothetical protein